VKELSKTVTVINELGLHSRPAAMVAEIAGKAESNVWIIKGEDKVDAASIIDILTLAAAIGSKIIIQIEEKSDRHILNRIVQLLEKGFEE
jgi:phosphocarrier protein HPr